MTRLLPTFHSLQNPITFEEFQSLIEHFSIACYWLPSEWSAKVLQSWDHAMVFGTIAKNFLIWDPSFEMEGERERLKDLQLNHFWFWWDFAKNYSRTKLLPDNQLTVLRKLKSRKLIQMKWLYSGDEKILWVRPVPLSVIQLLDDTKNKKTPS